MLLPDYYECVATITLEIFDDRVEIFNPGLVA